MKDTSELQKTYLESIVVDKGGYPYFINSISDGNPPITKELLDQIVECFTTMSDLDCDLILAPEAMAIPYATALTLKTGIPFQIIRKRGHGIPGEIVFDQSTGYSKSTMYLAGVTEGTKVILIDDVISTGGTFRAIVNVLRKNGIIIEESFVILNKSEDLSKLETELDIKIHPILDVGVEDGRPVLR